jgi:protein-disulfide isomerase
MPASFARGLRTPALAALLSIAVGAPLGCHGPGGAGLRAPDAAAPEGARGEDAAGLPRFAPEDGAPGSTEIERYKVELGDAPVRGSANAPVTVVMFSDFECPYCREGYLNLRELERRYEGRVRIAYKAFPLDFHSGALPAAIAARTAQAAGRFWEFHDRVYAQREVDLDRLFDYAADAGIDPKLLARDLDSLDFGPEVRRDMRQARRLGVSSTPTFFINGRQLSGAQPVEEMSAVVDEELALAKGWAADGVAPADIYAHAIKDGFSAIEYSGRRRGLDPDSVAVVPIGKSPVLGPADAPVTIVAFNDFECPFCARGNAVVSRLRARYGDKIRLVYKSNPLPFHSHAFIAARAAMSAAAQGKFWAYHDALYATGAKFDEDKLIAIAKQVGLDVKRFKDDIQGGTFDAAIDDDLALGAMLGVSGTPAYFVNGRPVEGALPDLHFRLIIEEELERAAAAVARGVAKAEVYDALMRTPLE